MNKTYTRLPLERAVKLSKLPVFEQIRNRSLFENENKYLEHFLSSESISFYSDVKALFKQGNPLVLSGVYCAESKDEVNNLMLGFTNLLKELRVYSKQSFGSLDSILVAAKLNGGYEKIFETDSSIEDVTQLIMELITVSYELYKIQMISVVYLGCILHSTYINNQKLIIDTIGYHKYIEIISLSYSLSPKHTDVDGDDFLRQVLKEQSSSSSGEFAFKEINTSIKEKVLSAISSDSMEFIMGQLDTIVQDSSTRNALLARDQFSDSDGEDCIAYTIFTTLLSFESFTILTMGGFIYGIDTLSGWTYYLYEPSDSSETDAESEHLLKMEKHLLKEQFSEIAAAFKSITYTTFQELYISDNFNSQKLSINNQTKH